MAERSLPPFYFKLLLCCLFSSFILCEKAYYTANAITFLRQYGHYYDLFGYYFNTTNKDPLLSKPRESRSSSLDSAYLIRDFTEYDTMYMSAANRPIVEYDRMDVYSHPYRLDLQNMYRYGPNFEDRFLGIHATGDPWDHSVPYKGRVNFIGFEVNFHAHYHGLRCEFHYPVKASVDAVVREDVMSVLATPTPESRVCCSLPEEVIGNLSDSTPYISLDAVILGDKKAPANESSPEKEFSRIYNIRLTRVHELDRRNFNLSMTCETAETEDPMIVEYLVYHILMGVQHFYLFDNSKKKFDVASSQLRPFMESNILTLIHWPFCAKKGLHDFYLNQRGALNVYLSQFGQYTKFAGLNDIDEFFVPSPGFLPNVVVNQSNSFRLPQNQHLRNQISHNMIALKTLNKKGAWDKIPAIGFDSVEASCPSSMDGLNSFGAGNNLEALQQRHPELSAAQVQDLFRQFQRVAVTTFCNNTGMHFVERNVGHGKIFIKPNMIPWLTSPHRYNAYYFEETTPHDGGSFWHYSGALRYSYLFRAKDSRHWDGVVRQNSLLHDLTYSLLQNINVYYLTSP